ncbi:uncharacterized protein SPSC_04262 [Sporisorium scitamineum]|uniref:Uncharacterized protein n=1 Tax=Sporisorium scitamineum TaxID=49012 RepID=A0A127Z3Z4_9BASI|nr:uncharacterized protein SPSC_04262 [Sporisorium scitamineum]
MASCLKFLSQLSDMSQTQQSSPPEASDLLCTFDGDSNILGLECDSHSLDLQSYHQHSTESQHSDPAQTPRLAQDITTTSSTSHPLSQSLPKRGSNWSSIDQHCFTIALNNHNPWAVNTQEKTLLAWQEAIAETNRALVKHKWEVRIEGTFEAQWKRMLKDVKEKKVHSLKATGANFNENEAYATLYNLVDLYNASKMKFSFLKPVEPLAVQIERFQWQKRKQAVSQAWEAGQTGQTLALQRLRDWQISSTPTDGLADEDQSALGDDDNEDSQSSASQLTSPAQKRHKTHKTQIEEMLINTLDKLVEMQAKALSLD